MADGEGAATLEVEVLAVKSILYSRRLNYLDKVGRQASSTTPILYCVRPVQHGSLYTHFATNLRLYGIRNSGHRTTRPLTAGPKSPYQTM